MCTCNNDLIDTRSDRQSSSGRRFFGLATAAMLILALAGFPRSALPAAKLCVPQATGVPYWAGAPNWWDSYPDTDKERLSKSFSRDFRRTEDPRWRGALSIDYGAGATDPAEFRALYDGQALLLSWSSKTMDFHANSTSVVLGIKLGTGSPIVLRTRINATSTETAGTVPPTVTPKRSVEGSASYLAFTPFQQSGMNWTSQGVQLPTWAADNTRVWIMPAGGSGSKPAFTLQMRIPTNGVQNFRMWYSIQPSVPTNGEPGLASFTWPRGDALSWAYYEEIGTQGVINHVPDVTSWGEFFIGPNSACAGVTLADSDIGVKNMQFPTSSSQISITQLNRFYALPENIDNATRDLSNIKATFYFANWGSQRGTLTGSSWSTLTPNLVNQPVQNPPTTPFLSPAVATDPTQVPAQGKAQIASFWSLGKSEICRFFVEGSNPPRYLAEEGPNGIPNYCSGEPTPTLNPHSCMLVKLDGPVEFLKDSALTNMDFAKASTFSRIAEITTAPGARDVYLFVDRRNMPMVKGSGANENRTSLEPQSELKPIPVGGQLKEIHQALSRGIQPRMSYEQLAAVMPTYAIHAFHSAGKNVLIDGKPHILLDQQTSFGYFVWHEGPLYGWGANLSGATPLQGDSVFKVAVPDGGSVKITNELNAIETAKPATQCKCACGDMKCLMACKQVASNSSGTLAATFTLFGSIGVGGLAFLRRRSKGGKLGIPSRFAD